MRKQLSIAKTKKLLGVKSVKRNVPREGNFEEGQCQECGEALNNAEGTLCFKCKVAELEYNKD